MVNRNRKLKLIPLLYRKTIPIPFYYNFLIIKIVGWNDKNTGTEIFSAIAVNGYTEKLLINTIEYMYYNILPKNTDIKKTGQ